ncbi:uncharacterized protein LOC111054017 [Nilaparvata lugens]|uniref:uncharacterized protein LOC111054017 n=1 Tax=Nilaparvata lugens TaxID=108931 RepID=UPI00193E789A|nr:uncharacterized protein LOC111054017 [Nilaparvata lugens]
MIVKKVFEAYHRLSSNIFLRTIMFVLLLNETLNIVLAVINYWNVFIERFMGLKDIVLFVCLSSCAVDISFRYERSIALLSVIEEKFVGENSNWNVTSTCALYRQQLIDLDKRVCKVITISIFNMNIWPLLAVALFRVSGVKTPHPPLPCAYYLPQSVTSHPVTSYVTMFVLQSCCLWIFAAISQVILSSIIVAIQKSAFDFELFFELVDRFDKSAFGHEEKCSKEVEEEEREIKTPENQWREKGGNRRKHDVESERVYRVQTGRKCSKENRGEKEMRRAENQKEEKDGDCRMYGVESERQLREQTRMLVAYHQKLYNTMKILSENAGFGTSLSNIVICLMNCVYLYLFVKTNVVVIRIFAFCFVTFSSFLVFFYCHCGQNIINKNEDVRIRLAEVSWINRPKWFQRALILMITRSNAEVHLKPYGIYVLNHAMFTNILNLSYSSSNVLKALS